METKKQCDLHVLANKVSEPWNKVYKIDILKIPQWQNLDIKRPQSICSLERIVVTVARATQSTKPLSTHFMNYYCSEFDIVSKDAALYKK